MRWSGTFTLPKLKSEKFVDQFMWFILNKTAKYFVANLIGMDMVPAFTGQARASLTEAAKLVGLSISFRDVVDNKRKNKNVSTGAKQGSAKFLKVGNEYVFEFSSWVADLTVDPTHNYWEENEYNSTGYPTRPTPWGVITEAGIHTEEYIKKEIAPLIKDFFGSDMLIRTTISF